MRHWIWLSVAPRLYHRWCHAFMLSRQRASVSRGSRTLQVSGKAFLLICTSPVTSGSRLGSIPMKHNLSGSFGSTLTVMVVCSILRAGWRPHPSVASLVRRVSHLFPLVPLPGFQKALGPRCKMLLHPFLAFIHSCSQVSWVLALNVLDWWLLLFLVKVV